MFDSKIKTTPGNGIRIKHIGVFDLNKIYKNLRKFLEEYEYIFQEQEHTEKDKPNGKEIIIKWTAERKVTNLIEYHIEAVFFLQKVFPAKDKKQRGEFQLTVQSYLKLEKKWQSSWIGNLLFTIQNNFTMKDIIIDHTNKLDKETKQFFALAKSLV